jgi:hypothetical protein
MRDATLLPQPVLVVPVKIGNAVAGEELRRRPRPRGFFRDGLGAVLTELGRVPMTGSGSGQAQLIQSKPSAWLSLSSVRADRPGPMACTDRFNATAMPGIPAAWSSGSDTASLPSSASRDLRIFFSVHALRLTSI